MESQQSEGNPLLDHFGVFEVLPFEIVPLSPVLVTIVNSAFSVSVKIVTGPN